MNELLNFEYNGCIIPFALTSNDVMINATEIAKVCKKQLGHYLSNQQTKELINEVSIDIGIPISELIVVIKGGIPQNQGTWMHRLIAIHFAMWCSPKFGVWCLRKLDEIINNGFALRNAEIGRLTSEITNLQITIQNQQPQVDYCNRVLTTSENLYSTRDIVKDLGLGISNIELLRLLEKNNLIFRSHDKKKWYLKEPFDKFGYTKIVTIFDKAGKPRNVKRWTEEGRHWIYSLSKKL